MKAVLDTNVVIASFLSSSEDSPGRRLLKHWAEGDFLFLYSRDTLLEYAEILIRKGVPRDVIRSFLLELRSHGEHVVISFFHLAVYPGDEDDIAFLLCALNGHADYLLSYDSDLLEIAASYDLEITEPIHFLQRLEQL